jgi:hypothetical protein
VVFCWSANFDYGILDKYVPDIVIFQIRERFLIRPPDDETGFTTTEIAFAKNHGKNPETQIAPVRYDADELLISCLSKIGYVGNKAYESALGDLCNRMDIQDVFNYSLTIDRHRTQLKKVKKLIESALTGC